jgi:hypothetical protein
MGAAIGDVLGLAAGVAGSPLPIVAMILILATPRGRANGTLFGGRPVVTDQSSWSSRARLTASQRRLVSSLR